MNLKQEIAKLRATLEASEDSIPLDAREVVERLLLDEAAAAWKFASGPRPIAAAYNARPGTLTPRQCLALYVRATGPLREELADALRAVGLEV